MRQLVLSVSTSQEGSVDPGPILSLWVGRDDLSPWEHMRFVCTDVIAAPYRQAAKLNFLEWCRHCCPSSSRARELLPTSSVWHGCGVSKLGSGAWDGEFRVGSLEQQASALCSQHIGLTCLPLLPLQPTPLNTSSIAFALLGFLRFLVRPRAEDFLRLDLLATSRWSKTQLFQRMGQSVPCPPQFRERSLTQCPPVPLPR